MNLLCELIQKWWQEEEGVTSIEYVLLASLIALVIIGSVNAVGDQVCERFKSVAEAFGSTATMTCS